MNRVAYLCDLREHYRGAGAYQEIRGKADGGIGRDAGEGVAAPALQADNEISGGARFSAAVIERFQPLVGHGQNAVDDFPEAGETLILHPQNIGVVRRRGQPLGQQQFGLQFFAAKTDDHDFAAEVRVARQILQRADRHRGAGRVDGNSAAIGVCDRNHVVDARIFRQQF
jgi:hypothetical protein